MPPVDAKVAELYADLVLRTSKFQAAIGDATAQTRKFSANMRQEMAQAQGAVRLLNAELGTQMPRALQSFLTRLPGVATAMSAAFNAVAIIGLIDIVVKAGEKVAEFAQKNEDAARKNAQAWQGITAPLVESNDELRVVNDKLAESIAKLQKKPQNGLKEAIDEAVVSADKLSGKLTEDLAKIQETLKNGSTGFLKELFGDASTSDIERKYANLQSRISDANTAGNQRIRSARDNGGDVDAAKRDLEEQLTALYREGSTFAAAVLRNAEIARQAQADRANGGPAHPDSERSGFNSQNQDARISAASGLLSFFNGQSDAIQLQQSNDALTKQENVLQKQQENVEAAKKAAAELLKTFDTQFEQSKARNEMSLAQDAAFWNSKLSVFKTGSDQYLAVLTRFTEASSAEDKRLASFLKDWRDRTGETPTLTSNKSQDSDTSAIAKGLEQQAELRAAIIQATTAYQLQTGAISAHDAAMTLAASHADEYRARLATLTAELAKLRSEELDYNGQNVDPENAAKQQQVQNQIDALNAKSKIQQLTDAQATLSTTWRGMIDGVFDELVRRSKDTTSQLKQIASSTIDSINGELAKGLTGQKTNFRGVLQSSSEQLAKQGIGKIEGVGLGLLGFGGGKRDGSSAATALYVEIASGGTASLGSSIPGLNLFGSSKPNVTGPGGVGIAGAGSKGLLGLLNDSNWASSLFGGKLFGAGSIFGGGFALGGDVMAGVPINVGELGVERFTPSVPGHITPNKDLGGRGHTYNIDARGTDPVQTQAAVYRGMRIAHASAVRDAQHAISERSRRRPQ